ncbi:hypothetical protein ACWCYK_31395 [Streptomyces lydicamycinicus]
MSTTNSVSVAAQPQETQPAPPAAPRETPARSRTALAWAQLGLTAACAGAGTVIGLMGHPGLGAAVATAGAGTVTVIVHHYR